MPPRKRKPKLSDILIARTGLQSPNQLAIYLAKEAAKKTNPCVQGVVILMYKDEALDVVWSELGAQDLDSLRRFYNFTVDDIYREQWYDYLSHPEDSEA